MSTLNGPGNQELNRPQRGSTATERPHAENEDEILNLKSAARLLGYSRSHLSKILAGRFPELPKLLHVRVGRTVRMRRGAVLEWFHQAENCIRDRDRFGEC
jgi:predicted DNA-binding transcriptional regulator AlpA